MVVEVEFKLDVVVENEPGEETEGCGEAFTLG
jgi:hypothetical protein